MEGGHSVSSQGTRIEQLSELMAGPPPLRVETKCTHETTVTQNETLSYLTVSYMSLLYLIDCDLLVVGDFRHSTSLFALMPDKENISH